MPSPKTTCRFCNAEILVTTSQRTDGLCMPCSQGARYRHVAYLTIEDFFAKATGDDCLAPNLDPHPTNEDFRSLLTQLSSEPGVCRCVIPVDEYQDSDREMEPYSDRVFVAGTVEERTIAKWAQRLQAEFYQEARPGKDIPLEYSNGQPGWFLVWD
jgi:hypothetical protein